MDAWMCGWMYGRMDGRMDGWIDVWLHVWMEDSGRCPQRLRDLGLFEACGRYPQVIGRSAPTADSQNAGGYRPRKGAGTQVASDSSFFKRAGGPHLPRTVSPLEETVERTGGGSQYLQGWWTVRTYRGQSTRWRIRTTAKG